MAAIDEFLQSLQGGISQLYYYANRAENLSSDVASNCHENVVAHTAWGDLTEAIQNLDNLTQAMVRQRMRKGEIDCSEKGSGEGAVGMTDENFHETVTEISEEDEAMSLDQHLTTLISIGVSVGVNCQPCLEHCVTQAKQMGIPQTKILDAIQVGKIVRRGAAGRLDQYIEELTAEGSPSLEQGGKCYGCCCE